MIDEYRVNSLALDWIYLAEQYYKDCIQNGNYIGMCSAFTSSIHLNRSFTKRAIEIIRERYRYGEIDYEISRNHIPIIIPEFNPRFCGADEKSNVLKVKVNADLTVNYYWWAKDDINPRLYAFDMLVKTYRKKLQLCRNQRKTSLSSKG